MTTISDVWEAHRDKLCEKLIELGKVHLEKLVMILSKEQIIDQNVTEIAVEMSDKETVEMVVQSVGSKIASDPTTLSHFFNIIKTFGIQPLAETIEDKMNSVGSLMIPGMLPHMPKGKGTPALSALPPIIGASSHDTGNPTHQDIQSDHPNATFSSNTQSQDIESGRIHTVASIQAPKRISSLTLESGNMSYALSEQATTLNSTSEPTLDHLNQDRPNQADKMSPGIRANDSGIQFDLSNSEVQRSLSGTSESGSDSGLLEGVSSPLKKKFQKIKGENRELKKRNAELTEENLGLKHEVSEWQKSYAFLQQQIHGLTKKYIEVCQHCQELEKEIEVSSDPEMVSLRLGRESEKVKEMEIEMKQLKDKADHYEKKIQELEQQKEEVVRMAVSQEYFLPDTCVEGHDDFDFAYYLARNNLENEGVKCKVCSQQIGKYCQVCLPAQFSHEEHVKLKLTHRFQSPKTTHSHIYSEALLRVACGGNYNNILKASINMQPTFITPRACIWNLPECKRCDESTSIYESDFKQRYEAEHYIGSPSVLVDSDAVLFYIFIHRGLAVNVDLMHYLSCRNCHKYVVGIRDVLHQAWNFRKTILSKYHNKDEEKKKEYMDKIAKEAKQAKENLLFHTVGVFPNSEYLIEFPFLCAVQTAEGSCALVYAQIPPCCWAVPLDLSSPALPELHSNFPAVVDKINKALFDKREEYLKSIPVKEGKGPKLIIRYLPECCLKVSLVSSDIEVVA